MLNYRLFPLESQTIFTAGPQTGVQLDNDVTNYVTAGGSASAPSEGKAWYFSGMRAATWGPLSSGLASDSTDLRAPTNLSDVLITTDLSAPGRATWGNTTLPSEVEPRVNPALVWIPVAAEGVLLAIGGVLHHQLFNGYSLNENQTEESEQTSPSFMTEIPVHDVASGDWHVQSTTGDAPDFRAEFCAVVASLTDDSSTYDIYIYGGDNGLSGSKAVYAHDDVWVLSIPSFHWVKVSDGTASHGRSGHTCALPFPNQMLVFGGQNIDSSNLCIQDGSVLDVFDLNTLEWTRKYSWNTYEDYKRPKAISDAINGANGADSNVKALFDTTYRTGIQAWYPYASPESNGTAGGDGNGTVIVQETSTGGGTNAGAIAGGVVGGVTALVIGFLLFWFCRPSRRAARKSKNSTTYTETTLGASAVSRWLRRTNFNEPPQGQAGFKEGSETDVGSNEDHVVPATHARPPTALAGPAELSGDQRTRHEMSSTDDGFSPRSSTAVENMTVRTRHTSVEAGGMQIHEMLDESTVAPRQPAQGPGQPYIWQADRMPFSSIDEKSKSEASVDVVAAAALSSKNDVSNLGSVPPSSDRGAISRNSADQSSRASLGGLNRGHEHRPTLDRNESSISSELPTTPPSRHASGLRMSANSAGPISPMLEENARSAEAAGVGMTSATTHRPQVQRHGSSLVSAVSDIDRAALRDGKREDGDRLEPQRILEGEAGEAMSPAEVSPLQERKAQPQPEMLEKLSGSPALKRSASRFKEDVDGPSKS